MDKKSRIDIYETIYNVVLVVANQYATIEEIREVVEYTDGEEIDDEVMSACANVTTCRRKSDKMDALLVKYNHGIGIKSVNKTLDFIDTVSHEAGHVALRIYQHMDQDVCFCSQEPFCYLLGWAAECIYKTVKGL
jgi:hypothetical protein